MSSDINHCKSFKPDSTQILNIGKFSMKFRFGLSTFAACIKNLAILLLVPLLLLQLMVLVVNGASIIASTNNTNTRVIHNTINQLPSFVRIYKIPDGEIVTKLRVDNFTAIETRFHHLDLIQIIKADHIIQLWISNGALVDCEYTTDQHTILNVYAEFNKINPNIKKDSKSFQLIEEFNNITASTLPTQLRRLTEYEQFEQQCSNLHQTIKSKYQKNGKKYHKLSRDKRDLLVFPGTKWCGRGSNSQDFEDLGEYTFADRCCRDHDRCKYSIGPFDTRYHLFNYRFHYISHCSCDERFRSCLKVANSGASNLVGKIFFNVVQTKCFMFQMDDVCQDRSWWGACLESKRRKRAVFRNPMTY